MGKRNPYRDSIDPEYERWGQKYRRFPGVAECVRLIRAGKARGSWADIIAYELAENARNNLPELIAAFHSSGADKNVGMYVMMALEIAALRESVEFLVEVLQSRNPDFLPYAQGALAAIDTRESRKALFELSLRK